MSDPRLYIVDNETNSYRAMAEAIYATENPTPFQKDEAYQQKINKLAAEIKAQNTIETLNSLQGIHINSNAIAKENAQGILQYGWQVFFDRSKSAVLKKEVPQSPEIIEMKKTSEILSNEKSSIDLKLETATPAIVIEPKFQKIETTYASGFFHINSGADNQPMRQAELTAQNHGEFFHASRNSMGATAVGLDISKTYQTAPDFKFGLVLGGNALTFKEQVTKQTYDPQNGENIGEAEISLNATSSVCAWGGVNIQKSFGNLTVGATAYHERYPLSNEKADGVIINASQNVGELSVKAQFGREYSTDMNDNTISARNRYEIRGKYTLNPDAKSNNITVGAHVAVQTNDGMSGTRDAVGLHVYVNNPFGMPGTVQFSGVSTRNGRVSPTPFAGMEPTTPGFTLSYFSDLYTKKKVTP